MTASDTNPLTVDSRHARPRQTVPAVFKNRLVHVPEGPAEYEKALQLKEAPEAYLGLCIDALKRAGANADQTRPGG